MANSIHSIIFMHVVLRLESAMSIGTGEKNAVVCDISEDGIYNGMKEILRRI